MKTIAVIGQGFVGGSLTTVFAERGTTVYSFDKAMKLAPGGNRVFVVKNNSPDKEDRFFTPSSISEFVRAVEAQSGFTKIYFVCVPTPMHEDGSADTTIVESVLDEISACPAVESTYNRIAVIKSTVPPGSTQRWNSKYEKLGLSVVFNPEFLTEANALNDMREQNRIILGGPRPHINRVKQLFQQAFPKVPIVKTGSTTAEMIKYLTNCHLAVKVAFANEVAQVCEALDASGHNIDYDKVIEYAKFDKRLGDSHWSVPGPVPTEDGRYVRGFGGHCFPKDLNALINVAKELGVEPSVMTAAWKKNLEVRAPEDRDWERQIGRAVSSRREKS